jgi:hypothetical protein
VYTFFSSLLLSILDLLGLLHVGIFLKLSARRFCKCFTYKCTNVEFILALHSIISFLGLLRVGRHLSQAYFYFRSSSCRRYSYACGSKILQMGLLALVQHMMKKVKSRMPEMIGGQC